MKPSLWRAVTASVLLVLAACESVAPALDGAAGIDVGRDPQGTTCAEWLALMADEQLALADRLVGDSTESLERIRDAQHVPVGTDRRALVSMVAGSLTKNCEVWPPRSRTLGELMAALYGD